MKYDVVTIGSATQDVFVRSNALEERKDPFAPNGIDACIPMGSKLGIDELHISSGGGATNAAVTFARFGIKTACIARIGKDDFGENLRKELKKERVETRFLQTDKERRTGYSVILLNQEGYRGILTFRGAARHLSSKELPWKTSKSFKTVWLYITSIGGDMHLLKEIFRSAENMNTLVAWNPGGREIARGLRGLKPLIKNTDVLLLNREEAAQLADLPQRHLGAIIEKLARAFNGILVITDGQKGAYAHAEGKTFFVRAMKGKRVNTTGAGDAFGSAFVAALAKKKDVETALRAAALNAHGVISQMGAKSGILKRFPNTKELKKPKVEAIGGGMM